MDLSIHHYAFAAFRRRLESAKCIGPIASSMMAVSLGQHIAVNMRYG